MGNLGFLILGAVKLQRFLMKQLDVDVSPPAFLWNPYLSLVNVTFDINVHHHTKLCGPGSDGTWDMNPLHWLTMQVAGPQIALPIALVPNVGQTSPEGQTESGAHDPTMGLQMGKKCDLL